MMSSTFYFKHSVSNQEWLHNNPLVYNLNCSNFTHTQFGSWVNIDKELATATCNNPFASGAVSSSLSSLYRSNNTYHH